MTKTPKILALALTLAAVPVAGAQARNDTSQGHGKGHGQAKVERQAAAGADDSAGARQGPPAKARGRCARSQRVGYTLKGTFVSFAASADEADAPSAGDLTLAVVRANRHARAGDAQRTLSTLGAKVRFEGIGDTGTDGVGFEDAGVGDRVKVVGKLVRPKRGCTGETSLVVRKVVVSRPAVDLADPGEA